MNSSKWIAFALFGAITLMGFSGQANAQNVFNEDFSTAVGAIPPAGWTTSGGTGIWRFDNMGNRIINAPLVAPIAICDSDIAGSGSVTNATMTSPPFDASTQNQILLEWDHWMRSLAATTVMTEVFDGATWNVVQTVTGADIATEANPTSASFDITAMAGGSTTAQVRFNYASGWDWYWLIDNIHVFEPAQNDLAIISIDTPVVNDQECINTTLTSTETVTITCSSLGSLPVPLGTAFTIDLLIDNVLVVADFFSPTVVLNQGDNFQFTFVAPVDLSAPGINTMSVRLNWGPDQDPGNDLLSLDLHQPVQGIGYQETFDNIAANTGVGTATIFDVPAGWSNDPIDGASSSGNAVQSWAPQTGASGAGPTFDHTQGNGGAGNYMYIDDIANQPGGIALITPCFDTSTAPSVAAMSFWHHSTVTAGSSADNILFVDVINETTGGTFTMSVASFMGNGSPDWERKLVDLSAFMPDIVRCVFRCSNDNNSTADDVAIDDVTFFDQLPAIGQPPVAGLAVLEMNSSLNVNSDPIAFGQPGPYFTTATAGGTLVISLSGESNQPVVMFSGPLNPRAAEFSGIGFMDVGGFLQANGLPSGLSLVGDGTAPGLLNSLFVISSSGQTDIGVTVPALPPGVLGAFQCAIFNSGAPGLTFSNCVELSVQ